MIDLSRSCVMTSILPETLLSITKTKISEICKQHTEFESYKKALLAEAEAQSTPRERLQGLLKGVSRTQGSASDDTASNDRNNNLRRFLALGEFDASVGEQYAQWEGELVAELDRQRTRHEHALFFSDLVTEWLEDDLTVATDPDTKEEDVVHVGREEMQKQRDMWESLVWTPAVIDEGVIDSYLTSLFMSTRVTRNAWTNVRKGVQRFSKKLLKNEDRITPDTLGWMISGIINDDLLPPHKVATLKEFRMNDSIGQEVADLLNMRMAAGLDTWSWRAAVPLEMRRQLNGKYRVYMDEDVLDALLLQYIGVKWGVELKDQLKGFLNSPAWKPNAQPIPHLQLNRRKFFLGDRNVENEQLSSGMGNTKMNTFRNDYFMSQLPDSEDSSNDYDGSSNDYGSSVNPIELKHRLLHMVMADSHISNALYGRMTVVRSDFKWFGPSLPHATILSVLRFFGFPQLWIDFFSRFLRAPLRFVQDGPDGAIHVRERGVPMGHSISAFLGEILLFIMDYAVNQHASGTLLYRLHDDFWIWGREDRCAEAWTAMSEFARVVGIEFNEEKTGTTHLCREQGGNDESFLEEPFAGMDIKKSDGDSGSFTGSDTESNHSGEEQKQGNGESESAANATQPLQPLPVGEVRWGFLKLDAEAGRFVIDQSMVDEHITELKHQLGACRSVFGWSKAWNSYVARFLTNNFGRPSISFGPEHIHMVLSTLRRIEQELFSDAAFHSSGTVANHLRAVIYDRFDTRDLPEGFFYFPFELGELGLRNPFITLSSMYDSFKEAPDDNFEETPHDNFKHTPHTIIQDAFGAMEAEYNNAKLEYERNGARSIVSADWLREAQRKRGQTVTDENPLGTFSFWEYIRCFESNNKNLSRAYDRLLGVPEESSPEQTPEMRGWLAKLGYTDSLDNTTICNLWSRMDPYWRWIAELYGRGVVDRFGGLSAVEGPRVVPIGVLNIMKEGKMRWQG